ncbi:MAG: hypothetical protein QOF89_1031 [Acidobacteriota bacterium]|jgi:hypothetical protein|nr:hypothetical protein [Acidobacteriota bacterium]
MAAVVNVTRISQAEPIASPASIQINFTVLGILPDVVQVFAGGVSGEIGKIVDQVDMSPPEIEYTSSFELAGGTAFLIHLCPRTVTNGVLDDRIDDQPFESFCTRLPFTTKAPPLPTARPKPPAPRINSLEPHQATLQSEGSILARWTAVTNFDQYHVIFEETNGRRGEVEINSAGKSGFFKLTPTFPGREYSLKVQGCITHLIGLNDCSVFSLPDVIVMPQNTRSLREFLRLSNAPSGLGIRSLGASVSAGIRAMMQL